VSLQLRTIVSAPFAENSYLLWKTDSSDAIVVDPGFDPDEILDQLAERELRILAILNTHGHVDHIAGNAAMKKAFPNAPLVIGHGDAEMLTDPVKNLSTMFGMSVVSPTADQLVREGDRISFAGIDMEVREIPGHSPGHVVFVIHGENPIVVLGGDVLMRGGIGRTDFPNGNFDQLVEGIQTKLWPLNDSTIVYPGHGPTTTIGHEKRTNPYCSWKR